MISDSFQNKGQDRCYPRPVPRPPWWARWLCAICSREDQAWKFPGLQPSPRTTTESANFGVGSSWTDHRPDPRLTDRRPCTVRQRSEQRNPTAKIETWPGTSAESQMPERAFECSAKNCPFYRNAATPDANLGIYILDIPQEKPFDSTVRQVYKCPNLFSKRFIKTYEYLYINTSSVKAKQPETLAV